MGNKWIGKWTFHGDMYFKDSIVYEITNETWIGNVNSYGVYETKAEAQNGLIKYLEEKVVRYQEYINELKGDKDV